MFLRVCSCYLTYGQLATPTVLLTLLDTKLVRPPANQSAGARSYTSDDFKASGAFSRSDSQCAGHDIGPQDASAPHSAPHAAAELLARQDNAYRYMTTTTVHSCLSTHVGVAGLELSQSYATQRDCKHCQPGACMRMHEYLCLLKRTSPLITYDSQCRRGFGAKVALPAKDVLQESLVDQPATLKLRAYHIGRYSADRQYFCKPAVGQHRKH